MFYMVLKAFIWFLKDYRLLILPASYFIYFSKLLYCFQCIYMVPLYGLKGSNVYIAFKAYVVIKDFVVVVNYFFWYL